MQDSFHGARRPVAVHTYKRCNDARGRRGKPRPCGMVRSDTRSINLSARAVQDLFRPFRGGRLPPAGNAINYEQGHNESYVCVVRREWRLIAAATDHMICGCSCVNSMGSSQVDGVAQRGRQGRGGVDAAAADIFMHEKGRPSYGAVPSVPGKLTACTRGRSRSLRRLQWSAWCCNRGSSRSRPTASLPRCPRRTRSRARTRCRKHP